MGFKSNIGKMGFNKMAFALLFAIVFSFVRLFAQEGIGTNAPDPSAALEVYSMDKGFLPPRMTKAQMEAINSPVEGLMVFCTDCEPSGFHLFTGTGFFLMKWDYPLSLESLDCSSPETVFDFYEGTFVRDATVLVDYVGSNGGRFVDLNVPSTGVTGLVAISTGNSLDSGNGELELSISGTPVGSGTAEFEIDIGGQTCSLQLDIEKVPVQGVFFDCSNVTQTGSEIVGGEPISNYTISIPYTQSNGGSYNEIAINSTGVTGISATAPAGNLNPSGGNLILQLSGTPNSVGIAMLNVTLGNSICSIEVEINKIIFNGLEYQVVVSGGGKKWLDRNLGAIRVAQSLDDDESFGYYYQWGRSNDGHQFINSTVSVGPVEPGQEGSDFISSSTSWMNPNDSNRWGSIDSSYDPCPPNFKVPTKNDWDNEISFWNSENSTGAFESPLKLPNTNYRETDGRERSGGRYWSSTPLSNPSRIFVMWPTPSFANTIYDRYTSYGLPVRCIENN